MLPPAAHNREVTLLQNFQEVSFLVIYISISFLCISGQSKCFKTDVRTWRTEQWWFVSIRYIWSSVSKPHIWSTWKSEQKNTLAKMVPTQQQLFIPLHLLLSLKAERTFEKNLIYRTRILQGRNSMVETALADVCRLDIMTQFHRVIFTLNNNIVTSQQTDVIVPPAGEGMEWQPLKESFRLLAVKWMPLFFFFCFKFTTVQLNPNPWSHSRPGIRDRVLYYDKSKQKQSSKNS